MRAIVIGLATLGFVSGMALVHRSAHAETAPFEIRGTWATDGDSCATAATFVEFDGRDMLGYANGVPRTRVASDYVVGSEDGAVTLSLTDLRSQGRGRLVFELTDADALRLDSAFGPVRLMRCAGHGRQLAAKP